MNIAKALKQLAEPRPSGEKAVDTIARTARDLGLKYSRCYELWYGRARRVEPHEIALVNDALEEKSRRDARNEFRDLKSRLARLESLLVQTDAEFHRDAIDLAREQMRGLGVPSGALARRTVK